MTDLCPNCGQPVRAGAKFCAKCGQALTPPVAPSQPAQSVQPSLPTPPAQSVQPPLPTPPAQARPTRSRTWLWVVIGVVVYLVAAAAVLMAARIVAANTPPPAPVRAAPAVTPRQAGQAGLDWLLDSAVQWQRDNQCNGCHVQSFAIMGAAAAHASDYDVDLDKTRELIDYLQSIQAGSGYITSGRGDVGPMVQTALAGMGVSEYDAAVDQRYGDMLVGMADWLVTVQSGDGSWPVDHHEPPVDQGQAMTTAGALMTLNAARRHDSKPEYNQAIERGAEWLAAATPETTQDIAFSIIGLLAQGAATDDPAIVDWLALLRSRQNADGGWGEAINLGSNGYATGQALYAYQKAGVPIRDDSFRNGVLWLLDNQDAGGWWQQVNSQQTSFGRSSNFATTMWGVIGLGEIFDVATESEFLSLIHPDDHDVAPPAWWALAIFLLLPALLVAGVWQRRQSARSDRRARRLEDKGGQK